MQSETAKSVSPRVSALPETVGDGDELLGVFLDEGSVADQTAFICSYRTFLTPETLLDKCLQRWAARAGTGLGFCFSSSFSFCPFPFFEP